MASANDLDIIQQDVDLNGQRLTNGAKTKSSTDLITRGEVVSLQQHHIPQFVIRDGFLIAITTDDEIVDPDQQEQPSE